MKIAIVKLSALGDIIHAMVALQYIKAYDPTIEIDWIVEQRFAELLNHHPQINHVLTVNLTALKYHKRLIFKEINRIRHYATHQYDWVIDAQGLVKSAIVSRLLSQNSAGFDWLSIREKIATYFYTLKIHSPYESNTIERNLKVLSEPLGFNIHPDEVHHKHAFLYFEKDQNLVEPYLNNSLKNILFVIGSTWESRHYPKEKFLQVANQLQQNVLILWGNNSEKSRAEWIAQRSDYAQVLPKLNLNQLKAFIAQLDLTLGNDTGPSHIAWGLNKPSLILFGCTPISRVYQTKINRVLSSSSIVNPYKLNKQDHSIQEIEVKTIVQQIEALLEA